MKRYLSYLFVFLMTTSNSVWASYSFPKGNWIDGGNKVEGKHLRRLYEIAQNDPVALEKYDRLMDFVGVKTIEDLAPFIYVNCALDFETRGAAEFAPSVMVSNAMSEAELKEEAAKQDVGVKVTNFEFSGDEIVLASFTSHRRICLDPKLSTKDAFYTFAHEAHHFVHSHTDKYVMRFLDQYSDVNDYVSKDLRSAGGEIEAFATAYGMKVRMEGRESLDSDIRDSFDDEGNLLDDRALVRKILPSYGKAVGTSYFKYLEGHHNRLVKFLNALQGMRHTDDYKRLLELKGQYLARMRAKDSFDIDKIVNSQYKDAEDDKDRNIKKASTSKSNQKIAKRIGDLRSAWDTAEKDLKKAKKTRKKKKVEAAETQLDQAKKKYADYLIRLGERMARHLFDKKIKMKTIRATGGDELDIPTIVSGYLQSDSPEFKEALAQLAEDEFPLMNLISAEDRSYLLNRLKAEVRRSYVTEYDLALAAMARKEHCNRAFQKLRNPDTGEEEEVDMDDIDRFVADLRSRSGLSKTQFGSGNADKNICYLNVIHQLLKKDHPAPAASEEDEGEASGSVNAEG